MTGFIFMACMAALAAGAVLFVLEPMKRDRKLAAIIAVAVPVACLAFYLPQGLPGQRGAPAPHAQDIEARRGMLLAQKPMEILEKQDPEDAGALMTLGDISLRLGKTEAAAGYYARALASAQKRGDPAEGVIREKMGRLEKPAP